MRPGRAPALLSLALVLVTGFSARAQSVAGSVWDDRDADGVRDADEPALAGVAVRLFGTASATGATDQTVLSGADGAFAFTPGDGCYLLATADPPGWRPSPARHDARPQSSPGYTPPVGLPRFGRLDGAVGHLAAGRLRYAALGDSIARNFNVFCGGSTFAYSRRLRSRLACAAPAATIPPVDEAAVLGEHSDDLLVDDTADLNNVFRVIEIQPELISLSIIGNDLLDVDPGDGATQQQINRAVAEVLDARRNIQETLAAFVSEVPGADVILNTLYDNEAHDCTPSTFHRAWLPVINRILRDLAWGQARRVGIAEVAADFAALDQSLVCNGFQDRICANFLDGIHPDAAGYEIVGEKLWEAAGGASLGPGDALDRASIEDVDLGYLRRVRRLLPRAHEVRGGAVVERAEAALDDADGGAAASIELGNGVEEFRLSGFPDWYDEVQIVRVVAGVRYRTSGPGQAQDDLYRIEASLDGVFEAPPGHAYTPTAWNFYTPIVGGGGPGAPPENPDYPEARTLVVPNPTGYREVSASLTGNPVLPAGAADYVWPAPTHEDLATTVVRVVAAPDPGAAGDDDYRVELDQAWLDLYGWEKPRPDEVRGLRLERRPDGSVATSFDPLDGAARYNLYQGRLSTLAAGAYDHGGTAAPAPALCDAPVAAGGDGRLEAVLGPSALAPDDAYFLVTGHVDDVESPSGARSDGAEIDRSRSICR